MKVAIEIAIVILALVSIGFLSRALYWYTMMSYDERRSEECRQKELWS